MRPENTRITRRERRRAWRGIPTGRHATRRVQATYGRHQRDRDWRERMSEALAALRTRAAAGPEGSGCLTCGQHIKLLGGIWTDPDGGINCMSDPAPYAPHKPATEGRQL